MYKLFSNACKVLLVFVLLLFTLEAAAQIVEGSIYDKETITAINGVTIQNKLTGSYVFSDTDGHFFIKASPGDTLLFRHTAYVHQSEVVTFSFGNNFKTILLQPIVYKLKETTVVGLTKYQKDSLDRYQTYHHELEKTLVPIGVGGGYVGWVADKITGNSKKHKNFRKEFAIEEENKFVDSRYTRELVISLTDLRDTDSIAIFMNTYPLEYSFVRTASDLELKAVIRNNYKQYLENKAIKK